ncbi:transmembrane protein, putative (macronuclear) [Tetrahymena thermophila SB210]|uniref:Transmembrane protein, putative n=1 Tax=Tetrahymena thermophila (strain SB210) TaxID=312017 RepID=W7X0H7_TETTS|nr:transmembrane protein, putative [Tetrahymena thermophila SB210]EWS72625.1 transmembrane protein, putative [Tetrahymena thermophila SB210]|eukprot:XP_012654908.1 transmembrane protein, putative [Tetrahymena thermophila SB210]
MYFVQNIFLIFVNTNKKYFLLCMQVIKNKKVKNKSINKEVLCTKLSIQFKQMKSKYQKLITIFAFRRWKEILNLSNSFFQKQMKFIIYVIKYSILQYLFYAFYYKLIVTKINSLYFQSQIYN